MEVILEGRAHDFSRAAFLGRMRDGLIENVGKFDCPDDVRSGLVGAEEGFTEASWTEPVHWVGNRWAAADLPVRILKRHRVPLWASRPEQVRSQTAAVLRQESLSVKSPFVVMRTH